VTRTFPARKALSNPFDATSTTDDVLADAGERL
jgi:hypothetical protein